MEFKKALIHQSPEEQQAYNTAGTTEAVKDAHDTLKEINETTKSHATSSDIGNLSSKLDELKSVTTANHPEKVEMKLNEVLDSLDNVAEAIRNIPQVQIPEYPEHPVFPEIPKTDLTETNKILKQLLNKEVQEYPEFPVIPEPKDVDFTATNKLLQKLLEKKDDSEISITATLEIT